MNDVDHVLLKKPAEEIYKFGLSTLHARIKCMVYILHIAHRAEFFHVSINSCGEFVDFEKFRSCCHATARKFVELYSWYYMPSSVHKLLIHIHFVRIIIKYMKTIILKKKVYH